MHLTVRGPAGTSAEPTTGPPARARRSRLTAPQFAALAAAAPVALPPPFATTPPAATPPGTAAPVPSLEVWAELVHLGLARPTDPDRPRPQRLAAAIEHTLQVLATALVSVHVEVLGSGRGRSAWLALSGQHGAGLVSLGAGAVELSAFPPGQLAAELTRLVPPVTEMTPARPGAGIAAALGAATTGPPLAGTTARDTLTAVTGFGPALRPPSSTPVAVSAADAALVGQLAARMTGQLVCRVYGSAAGTVSAGRLVWVSTDDGWVALRPDEDARVRTGQHRVRLQPVHAGELSSQLAPLIAQIAAVAADQTHTDQSHTDRTDTGAPSDAASPSGSAAASGLEAASEPAASNETAAPGAGDD